MIIIPAIDLKGGKCVRLIQGDMDKDTVYSDDPVAKAKEWESGGSGIIHIVDLDGAVNGEPRNRGVIEAIRAAVDCTVQLGGGIRDMATADAYFELGLDRLVIGSLLLKNPEESKRIAEKYPGKVVAGIDVKDNMATADGWYESSSVSGRELVEKIADWPLAGIVFTDISRDGMMQGANIEAIADMASVSDIPLIASGGVSSRDDLDQLSKIDGVWGAIIGKALYTGAIDLHEAVKDYQSQRDGQ